MRSHALGRPEPPTNPDGHLCPTLTRFLRSPGSASRCRDSSHAIAPRRSASHAFAAQPRRFTIPFAYVPLFRRFFFCLESHRAFFFASSSPPPLFSWLHSRSALPPHFCTVFPTFPLYRVSSRAPRSRFVASPMHWRSVQTTRRRSGEKARRAARWGKGCRQTWSTRREREREGVGWS